MNILRAKLLLALFVPVYQFFRHRMRGREMLVQNFKRTKFYPRFVEAVRALPFSVWVAAARRLNRIAQVL
jgi:hypothetical protein